MLKVSSEHIIPSLYQHCSWCVIHAYRRVGRLCKPDGTDSLPAAPCIVRVYKLMEEFLCSSCSMCGVWLGPSSRVDSHVISSLMALQHCSSMLLVVYRSYFLNVIVLINMFSA